jgi:ubiquitin-like protein Pup
MSGQVQVQKQVLTKHEDPAAPAGPSKEFSDKAGKLGDDLDDLLDEIDGLLEENAQEFVESYIQKSGE